MAIFITVLLVLAGIIVLLLILALVARKTYHIQREIIINAPLSKVFDYVKKLRNQDNYNKWVMADPNMKRDYRGVDGETGFIYAWNGNKKAGQGEQEIKHISEGKSIQTEIRFVRPFTAIANSNIETHPLSDSQTKVNWSNESKMKFPLNIMIVMVEKMLVKDMDTSLNNLKAIMEE